MQMAQYLCPNYTLKIWGIGNLKLVLILRKDLDLAEKACLIQDARIQDRY